MKPLPWNTRRWSTPATIGSGLFVALTGLLMISGPTEGPFKFTHELAGLLFSVSMVLHVLSNWRPFGNCFSQVVVLVSLLAAWLVGTGLVVSSSVWGFGVDPEEAVIARVSSAPLSRLAPVVGDDLDVGELVERLEAAGLVVREPVGEASLEQVAAWSDAEVDDVLALAFE